MPDETTKPASGPPSVPPPPDVPAAPTEASDRITAMSLEDSDELVRSLGMVFSQALMYGPDHSVTRKVMVNSFKSINLGLEMCQELQFSISDDALLLNNIAVPLKNPLTRSFITHLTQRDIRNFSLVRGLTFEKFSALIDVLNQKPDKIKSEGGFSHVIGSRGIDGVRAAKVSFVQVTEDDVVISKDTLMETVGSEISADQILNLLKKGSSATDADRALLRSIQNSEKSTELLGEAIMGAAKDRVKEAAGGGDGTGNGAGGGAGPSLVETAVEYMQQTYEVLASDPSTKTQKGKKNLLRIVSELEEEIKKRIREAEGELTEADAAKIAETVEGMTDELKIDALATEYMKKRGAIDTSEKRILRFIKTKGLDQLEDSELREKLQDAGLTMDDWRELLAKSGLMDVGHMETVDFAGMNVTEHLAGLLQSMSKALAPPPLPPDVPPPPPVPGEDVRAVLTQINREVGNIMTNAGARIDQVIADFQEDVKSAKKGGRTHYKMSRRRLMEVLAEVGQEICQPLAVVNCAIEMILNKSLGDVTDPQMEMLTLANDGGQKLKQLADKLMEISGLPETMNPDADIQDDLFDR